MENSYRLIMGENVVWRIATSVLIRSSSNLQITRTAIKSRTRSILGQLGYLFWSYSPLSDKKFSHRLKVLWLLIETSSNSQVTRTAIKSWPSLNSHQTVLFIWELLDPECRKTPFLAHLSRRLTKWAYSIEMVHRRPSVVIGHTCKLEYLRGQLANLDQILYVASLDVGNAAYGCQADWIKTLVSMATENFHRLIMGKMLCWG